jgi:hypothetical protein
LQDVLSVIPFRVAGIQLGVCKYTNAYFSTSYFPFRDLSLMLVGNVKSILFVSICDCLSSIVSQEKFSTNGFRFANMMRLYSIMAQLL